MPIWTTMMARVMFSSCILWQYILIVFMPTLGSSARVKKSRMKLHYCHALIVIFISRKIWVCTDVGNIVTYNPTRKENKHLVSGVIVVCHQHSEVCASGATLAGLVTELALKLIQRLIQFILCHQVASIVTELKEAIWELVWIQDKPRGKSKISSLTNQWTSIKCRTQTHCFADSAAKVLGLFFSRRFHLQTTITLRDTKLYNTVYRQNTALNLNDLATC